MRYTWIPFYKELAEKLMNYRNDRASLLSLIYENREKLLAKYLHDNKGVDDLLVDVGSLHCLWTVQPWHQVRE